MILTKFGLHFLEFLLIVMNFGSSMIFELKYLKFRK
jgi:hypothetical protein